MQFDSPFVKFNSPHSYTLISWSTIFTPTLYFNKSLRDDREGEEGKWERWGHKF